MLGIEGSWLELDGVEKAEGNEALEETMVAAVKGAFGKGSIRASCRQERCNHRLRLSSSLLKMVVWREETAK